MPILDTALATQSWEDIRNKNRLFLLYATPHRKGENEFLIYVIFILYLCWDWSKRHPMEVEIPHRVMCGRKNNSNDIPTYVEMMIRTLTCVQNGDQIVVKSVPTNMTFIYENDLIIETSSVSFSYLIRPNKMNLSQQSCIID